MRLIAYMNIVVDIGNTNIVCAVYHNNGFIWHVRLKTDTLRTADEYYAQLLSLKSSNWEFSSITVIAIASVVPDMTRIWQHLFRKYLRLEPLLLSGHSPIGLSFRVKNPGFIGADLIANALGAWKKYSTNAIIVDLGTATTIQLITSSGLFMGVIIAPGIRTATKNLFEKAALISEIELTAPSSILGTNTNDAVLSGAVRGHAIMIEGFIQAIKEQNSELHTFKTILTGGISDLLQPLINSIDIVDKTLTIDGIYLASCLLKSTPMQFNNS
jgi:type III pantothenate kinase